MRTWWWIVGRFLWLYRLYGGTCSGLSVSVLCVWIFTCLSVPFVAFDQTTDPSPVVPHWSLRADAKGIHLSLVIPGRPWLHCDVPRCVSHFICASLSWFVGSSLLSNIIQTGLVICRIIILFWIWLACDYFSTTAGLSSLWPVSLLVLVESCSRLFLALLLCRISMLRRRISTTSVVVGFGSAHDCHYRSMSWYCFFILKTIVGKRYMGAIPYQSF